ncbi:hypothetical protein [Streptomyces sp. SAJ15]|uniref:hypothetical protein n=1 Tax=Streptomyces sp. SAJ15 TaxID=2011095 RepID=UPI0011855134|nr:hypothetical protein [Streptomyces sp. SAJ15]TVL89927.1 hypothetical protein CD790_24295 [Streptomyces sp. SAJ15]
MEQQQATTTLPGPFAPVDVEQAEAAIVEHYPRLVRIGYLILPPGMARTRRVLTAHAVAQRSLPRSRANGTDVELPEQRTADGLPADPGYAFVRLRVVRGALAAARLRRPWRLPRRGQLPPLLPQVWGLRLFPRSGGADELALDQALAQLSAPARAAYVLRGLERLTEDEVRAVLRAAGASNPDAALDEAAAVRTPAGSHDGSLLQSAEFDPCALQARPTDLMRRRQHTRAALAAAAAVVVCGTLLGMPGEGWGPDGAAAPPYAQNAAVEQALEPAKLTRAAPDAWRRATRADFAAWPARGDRLDDTALLRRALAVWARPGSSVQVAVTPGTQAGPPAGPPQLLYAGKVDQAAVVLLYDGLRIVRYAEAADGAGGSAALDFARADAGNAASSTAVIVGRTDGNVRYLTAPWVRDAAVRDLLVPDGPARPLRRSADGVTAPIGSPAQSRDCKEWNALQFGSHLVTDLGELIPARLTYGAPGAPRDVAGPEARTGWARSACTLAVMRSRGVRSVNSWPYAQQPLPDGTGIADWACVRAETWRGTGSRVLAQFQPPGGKPGTSGAVAAAADDSPACGPREPHVLSGVLWKSQAGRWFVLAAGGGEVTSIAASGGVEGAEAGQLLALPAKAGERAELRARLADGRRITSLR